jgi:hypothetical protein
MFQDPTPISRATFLRRPGELVIQGEYTQTTSPTLSSSRARWNELREWTSFPVDVQTFWDSIPAAEQNQALFTVQNLQFYQNTVLANLPRPTNEDMLSQHLDQRYNGPHNWTKTLQHSEIIRRDPAYPVFGEPDYLFVAHSVPGRALHAVMELKTFWKVTHTSLTEMLGGISDFLSRGHSFRCASSRVASSTRYISSWTTCTRTNLRLHGTKRDEIRSTHHGQRMGLPHERE